MKMEVAGMNRRLTKEQVQVLRLLKGETLNHLVVEAPAGTGKTYVTSLYILKLLEKNEGDCVYQPCRTRNYRESSQGVQFRCEGRTVPKVNHERVGTTSTGGQVLGKMPGIGNVKGPYGNEGQRRNHAVCYKLPG